MQLIIYVNSVCWKSKIRRDYKSGDFKVAPTRQISITQIFGSAKSRHGMHKVCRLCQIY